MAPIVQISLLYPGNMTTQGNLKQMALLHVIIPRHIETSANAQANDYDSFLKVMYNLALGVICITSVFGMIWAIWSAKTRSRQQNHLASSDTSLFSLQPNQSLYNVDIWGPATLPEGMPTGRSRPSRSDDNITIPAPVTSEGPELARPQPVAVHDAQARGTAASPPPDYEMVTRMAHIV